MKVTRLGWSSSLDTMFHQVYEGGSIRWLSCKTAFASFALAESRLLSPSPSLRSSENKEACSCERETIQQCLRWLKTRIRFLVGCDRAFSSLWWKAESFSQHSTIRQGVYGNSEACLTKPNKEFFYALNNLQCVLGIGWSPSLKWNVKVAFILTSS